jgi:hypothetical protein
VLYVGAALGRSVHDCLADHMAGRLAPTAQELFAVSPDIYFDFVAAADISDPEELKDIAGAFIAKSKPRFNTGPAPSSGKYQKVEVEELG